MQIEDLNPAAYAGNLDVTERTAEIARNVHRRPRSARQRSYKQIFEDSLLGVSLEHAELEYLVKYALDNRLDWTVEFAPDDNRSYDLSILTPKGKFLVDVKAMRNSVSAKTFTVNQWEAENADPHTIYMVFDTEDETNSWFVGWFECQDLQQSYKFHGYFVWMSRLRSDEQLPF
jgi:hypothetical protein